MFGEEIFLDWPHRRAAVGVAPRASRRQTRTAGVSPEPARQAMARSAGQTLVPAYPGLPDLQGPCPEAVFTGTGSALGKNLTVALERRWDMADCNSRVKR